MERFFVKTRSDFCCCWNHTADYCAQFFPDSRAESGNHGDCPDCDA